MNKILSGISKKMIHAGTTIAVAESVTSGLLQAALSSVPNSLDFFQGGITCYNIDQKVKHLNIERKHAERCNCVSRKVAIEMAFGVSVLFKSNWGIGITGYASPVPEKKIYRRYAWVAVTKDKKVIKTKLITAPALSPQKVQQQFRQKVLKLVAAI